MQHNTSLKSLWQNALSRPLHNTNCGCSVPSAGFLKAEDFELDLLDYVEEKFQLQNNIAWCNARIAREKLKTSTYPDWMNTLRSNVLPESLYDLILTDIKSTLESITEHSTGRLVPVASLQSGWLGDRLRSNDWNWFFRSISLITLYVWAISTSI